MRGEQRIWARKPIHVCGFVIDLVQTSRGMCVEGGIFHSCASHFVRSVQSLRDCTRLIACWKVQWQNLPPANKYRRNIIGVRSVFFDLFCRVKKQRIRHAGSKFGERPIHYLLVLLLAKQSKHLADVAISIIIHVRLVWMSFSCGSLYIPKTARKLARVPRTIILFFVASSDTVRGACEENECMGEDSFMQFLTQGS